jgi:hypothetical protein
MSALGAIVHFVHFGGFSLAIGASFAAQRIHAGARGLEASKRASTEEAAASLITKLALPAWFLTLFGGILGIVHNPAVFNPKTSGAGPWLHIKLLLVLILLVVAHLRMFRARRVVRMRADGANESEIDGMLSKAMLFGRIELALVAAVFFLATFRFVLFGGA